METNRPTTNTEVLETNRPTTNTSMLDTDEKGKAVNYLYDRRYNMVSSEDGAANSHAHMRSLPPVSHPGGSMKKMKLSYLSPKGADENNRRPPF